MYRWVAIIQEGPFGRLADATLARPVPVGATLAEAVATVRQRVRPGRADAPVTTAVEIVGHGRRYLVYADAVRRLEG